MGNNSMNIALYIERSTYRIMDLFIKQIDKTKSADLTLCILTYKWLFDTKEIYNWKLPEKLLIESFNNNNLKKKFINDLLMIETNNTKLNNIFTYLGINEFEKIELKDWDIFIDAYSEINFSETKNSKALMIFFDEFMEQIDNFNGNSSPKCIKKLLVNLLDPKEKSTIADITLGSGGLLAYVNKYIKKNNEDFKSVEYYGQDINLRIIALAKLQLLFNGITNSYIKKGDVLQEPQLNKNGELMRYDYIISDYPFNLINWNIDNDRYNRFPEKISKIRYADWIFNQHVIKTLNDKGKAVVVVSKGSLIRSQEISIRQHIVEKDLIESVILLPSSLYFGTAIPVAAIIFNKNKCTTRKNKIQFIDASKCFTKVGKNKSEITDKYIQKILNAYKNDLECEEFSSFIDIGKIGKQKYNLNSTEYIGTYLLKNKMKNSFLLKDVAEIKRGVLISKKDIQNLKQWPNYYYINIKDIEDGEIQFEKAVKIEVKDEWIKKSKIKPGDIIISAKGYGIKIALAKEYIRDSIISDNLLIIRVDSDKYDSRILKKYLDSPLGKMFLESIQTGASTIKVITSKNLENLFIPKVEKDDVRKLAQSIDYIEKKYKERIIEAKKIYKQETEEIYNKLGIKKIIEDIRNE